MKVGIVVVASITIRIRLEQPPQVLNSIPRIKVSDMGPPIPSTGSTAIPVPAFRKGGKLVKVVPMSVSFVGADTVQIPDTIVFGRKIIVVDLDGPVPKSLTTTTVLAAELSPNGGKINVPIAIVGIDVVAPMARYVI